MKLYQRSKLKQTASALKSVPSWNLTPSRSVNVNTVASSLTSHSVASEGSSSVVPGLRPIRVSKICVMTRIDSPSETSAPSRATGSDAPAKTSVPPDSPVAAARFVVAVVASAAAQCQGERGDEQQ